MHNKILIGHTTKVLDKGFIQLIDYMGTDETIVNAARVSYGNEELRHLAELEAASEVLEQPVQNVAKFEEVTKFTIGDWDEIVEYNNLSNVVRTFSSRKMQLLEDIKTKDSVLLRMLMRHRHGTPFEMCEVMFRIQIPMDAWRQMIRHRTANVNEYSTRYTEAIDDKQCTAPDQWRLQATSNKQGSDGFLTEWPDKWHTERNMDGDSEVGMPDSCSVVHQITKGVRYIHHQAGPHDLTPGEYLSTLEAEYHDHAKSLYTTRLNMGIAKEQARKDLPLSTYTRAYWKCDLRNIFHFLSLRIDSHAQLEIRLYANAMAEFIKQLFPVAYKAFEDYQLNAVTFSANEMVALRELLPDLNISSISNAKPDEMTKREWNEFKAKLGL